jgi:predicted nucleic acid-binding protein
MQTVVVDASALGALIFGEPEAEEVAGRLTDVRMIAPALLWFEVANICVKKTRAHPEMREKILDAFDMGGNLPIEIVEIDHNEAIALAMKTGLTAYDASYLWLAQEAGAQLVTLDGMLLKNLT